MKEFKVGIPGKLEETEAIKASSHIEAAYLYFQINSFDTSVFVDSGGFMGKKIITTSDLLKAYPNIADKIKIIEPKFDQPEEASDPFEFTPIGIFFWIKKHKLTVKILLSLILFIIYFIYNTDDMLE